MHQRMPSFLELVVVYNRIIFKSLEHALKKYRYTMQVLLVLFSMHVMVKTPLTCSLSIQKIFLPY